MKYIILMCNVLVITAAQQMYDTTNDDLDIEALVTNKARLQDFTTCFIHGTNCDEVSGDFKKDLKEAYEQACAKCTPAQKHILKRYLDGLEQTLPEQHELFVKTYDPENKFSAALKAAIANA